MTGEPNHVVTGEPIPSGFEQYENLRKAELDVIRLRRKYARRKPEGRKGSPNSDEVKDDLIGLALSGGGIRSAVFNLGFLQALSHRGFLRYVDYMCSVSGGGYVAGHLAALANSVAAEKNFHEITVEQHEGSRDILEEREKVADLGVNKHADGRLQNLSSKPHEKVAHLGVNKHGRLTNSYRFRHIGSYLFQDIAGFAWRYLLFTSITLLLVISLLGVVASSAALLWRSLDAEPARDVIGLLGIIEFSKELGIGDETLIAFLPSFVPLFFLMMSAVLRSACQAVYYRRGRSWFGSWCRFWLRAWGVSIAISFAVLLGNGEMTFSIERTYTKVQSNFIYPLIGILFLSLLPFLRFKSVVNSARPDAPAWKGLLATVLAALMCGAGPFFLVFWMARENISGYAEYRDPDLLQNDIEDWPAFIHLCDCLGGTITADRKGVLSLGPQTHRELMEGAPTWSARERLPFQSVAGAADRAIWLFKWLIGYPDNPIAHYQRLLQNQRVARDQATREFNTRMLKEKSLTAQLVAIACGKPVSQTTAGETPQSRNGSKDTAKPHVNLAWQGEKGGSPAMVGTELANRSREPGNFKNYWDRALLDSLILRQEDSSTFDAIEQYFEPTVCKWQRHDIARFNRLLLEALFPDVIRDRTMISTTIVPVEDQLRRKEWLLTWTLLSVVLLFVDWNAISPFYVHYRNKLSRSFVRSAIKLPPDPNFDEPELRLQDLEPCKRGAPFPLMLSSMHFFRNVAESESIRLSVDPPDADKCQPFSLSPLYCGSATTGWQPTKSYCNGDLKLADAVALSGAAVTPFMVASLGIKALMATANLRIGQWLPLPHHTPLARKIPRASGWKVGRELVSGLSSSASPKNYLAACRMALVADGGFHEFFGLEELLLRRCRLVIVADAGCNNGRYEFGALADSLRLLRISHGLEFLDMDNEQPVDLSLLRRGDSALQPLHHLCFRVRYPEHFPIQGESTETLVVYAQMSLTGDEELDLQQFRNVNPNFPDEPTTNQRYSEDQVESYRQLGFHIGEVVCGAVPKPVEGKVSASQWSAWFCQGYVNEWRRLTGSRFPTVETAYLLAKVNKDNLSKVDKVITEFLSTPEDQSKWYGWLADWFGSSRRPEAVESDGKFPKPEQIAQLVLACQAYWYHGGDLMQVPVFLPGGRARLCEFACRTCDSGILERGLDHASEVREELVRLLCNIGLAPRRLRGNTVDAEESLSEGFKDRIKDGLALVANLLIFWNDTLPAECSKRAFDYALGVRQATLPRVDERAEEVS